MVRTAILALLLSGCVLEEIPIDVMPQQSRVVVNSQFLPDNLLLVTVSRSFSALAPDDFQRLENDFVETLLVDSALILVSTAASVDTLEEIVPGLFGGELSKFEPGTTFQLSIFDSLTSTHYFAETVLMPQVRLDTAFVEPQVSGADTSYILRYAFTDPPGPNWYVVQANAISGFSLQDAITFEEQGDSVVFEIDSTASIFRSEPTNDMIFRKLLANLTLEDKVVERSEELFFDPGDTIAFTLINISEEYFRFLDASRRTGGIIASATNEPINFPTNVEGGFGFFALSTPHIRFVVRDGN